MKLKIKNYKSLLDLDIEWSEEQIISLIGLNGSGKTNILTAIYDFYMTTSSLNDNKTIIVSKEIDYDKWTNNDIEKINEKTKNDSIISLEYDLSRKSMTFIENKIKKIMIESIYNDLLSKIDSFNYTKIIKINSNYSYLQNQGKALPFGIIADYFTKSIIKEFPMLSQAQTFYTNMSGLKFFAYWQQDIETKINNSKIPGFDKTKKVSLINKINDIKEIEKIYKKLPRIKFIENSSKELKLKYQYDIKNLLNSQNNESEIIRNFLSSVNDTTALIEDGYWLANEFLKDINIQNERDIERRKNSITSKLNNFYQNIFSKNDIYAIPSFSFEGSIIKISVKTKANYLINTDMDNNKNSDGYKAILWFLINFEIFKNNALKNPDQNYFLLADEIEKNLHPLAQVKLIDYIKNEISSLDNLKVILSTHSSYLINPIDEIFKNIIVYRTEIGNTKIIDTIDITNELISSSIVYKISQFLWENKFTLTLFDQTILIDSNNHIDAYKIAEFEAKINQDSDTKIKVIPASEYTEVLIPKEKVTEITPTNNEGFNITNIRTKLKSKRIIKINLDDINMLTFN